MSARPLLGVFDSGVGGMSVLREFRKRTSADILYFGDCARAPYGNKSEEEIVLYIKDILLHLKASGVTHYISACNSTSVLTTSKLLAECGIDESLYIDTIGSFAKHASFPPGSVVVVGATVTTVRSEAYQRIITAKGASVYVYPFETLAKSIEEGEDVVSLRETVKKSLLYAQGIGATHYVYGCTHYPLIASLFISCAEEIGWKGVFVDPAVHVAEEVTRLRLRGNSNISFETSKMTDAFETYSRASIAS